MVELQEEKKHHRSVVQLCVFLFFFSAAEFWLPDFLIGSLLLFA